MDWYRKSVEETIEILNSSLEGLDAQEAEQRLSKFGPNEIKRLKKRRPIEMLLDQFKDFMILILIGAAIVSGIVGEPIDTIAILAIVVINGIIGFFQEYRAEKAIEALRKMAEPSTKVKRSGEILTVPSASLVPGDIVMIETGDIIPADMRLVESIQLKINEAAMTGESVAAEKTTRKITGPDLPIGDRHNMAFKGTTVVFGRGIGIVTETGMATELGKIATMLQEEEEVKTPLQRKLAIFGQKLAIIFLIICAIIFVFGILRGEKPILMLLTAVSLAVAAIPEALPAVITIALAFGAKKMVKTNALVRKLSAVETLGSVTYICSDKTGTLTQNKMLVQEIFLNGQLFKSDEISEAFAWNPENMNFFLALALSNDAWIDREGKIVGDPTEIALYSIARDLNFKKDALSKEYPRIAEIPFDSNRKCMTTFHRIPDGKIISYTKGALEALAEKSSVMTAVGNERNDKKTLLRINQKMAERGLRVLGIAMREWDQLPSDLDPDLVENNLKILGMVGMADPPREEVRTAIEVCKEAGIVPVMITGDHPITARSIALQLQITEEDSHSIVSGKELEALPVEEFEKRVEQIRIYARVAPEQKLKIVKSLQKKGQFVAMTGDGVNDAPALKRADIGIAMGIMGTDVAKEASHMILLDDNFATIVTAVKEGRRIFDNIRKFIKYLMTSNSGEIYTLFFPPFLGLPLPLLPIHLLWINLVTDGAPALALSAEPEEADIMRRPPRLPGESLFAHGLGVHIIWVGLLMAVITIFTQYWSIHIGDAHWQTMVFTVLCFNQMAHVLAIRSEKTSLFTQGIFSNKPLFGAVLLTFLLQLCVIYLPFLQPIFKTQPLTLFELSFCCILSSLVFFAVEIEKLIKRSKDRVKK